METYPLTIRPRCDTENEWIKYNPILKYREFVVSVDKNGARYKIGDGISKYDKLQFVSLEMAITNGIIYCTGGQYSHVKIELINENLDTKMARVDSALKDLCEDFCGFYITDIFDIVINLLEEVFHDQEEWIGYFVFEEDWLHGFKIGDVIVNDVPVYDFLIVNMEKENE